MKIDSSVIGMESKRSYSQLAVRSTKQTLEMGTGQLLYGDNLFGSLLEDADTEAEKEEVGNKENDASVSDIANSMKNRGVNRAAMLEQQRDTATQLRQIKQQCIMYLINLIFGRSFADKWKEENPDFAEQLEIPTGTSYAVNYNLTSEYYFKEEETTSFSTVGKVICADGREIDFNLDLMMSRQFEQYSYTQESFSGMAFCDPLVINLDGNIPDLSDQKFYFDLDQDGEEEELSLMGKGSGYLALDLNEDGIINDGGELFGTASGDGFADLARYDEDGNGWIDEGDSVFSKLKIWTMDENGNQKLTALKDTGVGAIGLAHTDTKFSLNSLQDNHVNGMIRKTGIFLYENGGVGTVQHVDLATTSYSA